MRSQKTDFSKYNSLDLCQAENLSAQIINRALALLENPKLSNKPFDARGLATWITKIRNQRNGKVIFNTAMQTAWEEQAIAIIETFNSQELANTIYALAKLEIKPSKAFIHSWTQKATAIINDFNSQALANSIYAFGKLGIKPSEAFLHAWTQKATATINNFNSQELANSIYAFGILEIKPSDSFIKEWEKQAIATIKDFNSQNLANSIYAFGILEIKPSDSFIKEWEKQAIATIKDFNSQNLANSIYAFGILGIKPSEAFIHAWIQKATATINNFNSQCLANSIYAFAKLETKPSDAFIKQWETQATATIKDFNSQELANSIYNFGILGIKPSDAFIKTWTQEATATIKDFNSQDLANSIYAFGILGIKPSDGFIKEWEKQAIATIKDFNSQNLANSIYALVLIQSMSLTLKNFGNLAMVESLYNQLSNKNDAPLTIETIHQLYTVMRVLKLNNITVNDSKLLEFLDVIKSNEKTTTSKLQKSVYSIMKDMNLNISEEVFVEEIGTSIDILYNVNNKKIAIQVDGPTHYNSDGTENAETKLNTLLLKEIGGFNEVVRIKYSDFDRLNTPEEQMNFINMIIKPFDDMDKGEKPLANSTPDKAPSKISSASTDPVGSKPDKPSWAAIAQKNSSVTQNNRKC